MRVEVAFDKIDKVEGNREFQKFVVKRLLEAIEQAAKDWGAPLVFGPEGFVEAKKEN